MRIEMVERQVLQVALQFGHPQSLSYRRVDFESLLRDALPGLSRHVLQGKHVVIAIGQFDQDDPDVLGASGISSVISIGDCLNPSTIAAAVYDGHRVAQEMDVIPENVDLPFKREMVDFEDTKVL